MLMPLNMRFIPSSLFFSFHCLYRFLLMVSLTSALCRSSITLFLLAAMAAVDLKFTSSARVREVKALTTRKAAN